MKIIMYTKDKCPNCERAKFMLNYSPVPVDLEIRNIESGRDAEKYNKQLTEVIKSRMLPTMLIPDKQGEIEEDNEMYRILVGFDDNLGVLQEVLGL
ncbi:glutaredoxin [Bacillus phage DK1]|uniref:Glutaredoxin n=1 Tax=Bacillus phage DK1 TaxID=2500808 RepID=A0A3T0IIU1_9CAUD|nr:thioredoxin domain [Bacillus phage DK1]AZU99710.1 glutaredoxin [Bacillus phage DK1]